MTRYTLTLLDEHRLLLKKSLFRDENEYAALALCGRAQCVDPWTGKEEERFLVHEIVEVEPNAFDVRTPTGFTWSSTPFYNLLKRAEKKNLAIAVVHSHPAGALDFSDRDDIADREIFRTAFDYLPTSRPHLSAIMTDDGMLAARAVDSDLKLHPVELIRVVGARWHYWYPAAARPAVGEEFDRQVRAFGRVSVQDLGVLRIGIVGCGGMGSAVLSLVSRLGAKKVALIDPDPFEETNLNRVHFSTRRDSNLRRLKVDVLGEAAADIGLSLSIVRLPYFVSDEKARDTLRSCDIVFGCTDDHIGRYFLNRLAHFYLIPVIDMGLLIEPNEAGGYDVFDGRVTVIQPGYVCQECRQLISSEQMLAESLMRNNPMLYAERRRAGYIPDAPDPSPVVVTFSTEVATMAVNELLQRLLGFRGDNGECSEHVRRFDEVKDADTVPGGKSDPNCKLCCKRKYDGRGDMEPFMDTTL